MTAGGQPGGPELDGRAWRGPRKSAMLARTAGLRREERRHGAPRPEGDRDRRRAGDGGALRPAAAGGGGPGGRRGRERGGAGRAAPGAPPAAPRRDQRRG